MGILDVLVDVGHLSPYFSIGTYGLVILAIAVWVVSKPSQDGQPEALPDLPIPGILNFWKFIFHTEDFLINARQYFDDKRRILTFWMGPQRVYLVTGSSNVQSVLRAAGNLGNEDLSLRVLPGLHGATKEDVARYANDHSGRAHTALDDTPWENRVWAQSHKIMGDHLSSTSATTAMMDKFCELLTAKFEEQPKGEWKTVEIWQFVKNDLVEAAITALAGKKLFELSPDFIDYMWRFDEIIFPLIFGVPRMFLRQGYANRDKFHEMGMKWLKYAFEHYDFDGPDDDWEEIFGSRLVRVHASWTKSQGLTEKTRSGMSLGTIWAQNANSAPIITWVLFEIVKDQELFKVVREESKQALLIDPVTGRRSLDRQKLIQLPLLASIYAEAMRLHVSVNVSRNVTADMELGGYKLKKGGLVQAPSMYGHMDEDHWGRPGHPPEQFWAERFIVYEDETSKSGAVKSVPKFSMTGHTGKWFPYGGGTSVCAGRNFAKQEIMAALALFVSTFDIEFVDYVKFDGTKSDRPPRDDPSRCGTAAMPPDRDMRIRWKRLQDL